MLLGEGVKIACIFRAKNLQQLLPEPLVSDEGWTGPLLSFFLFIFLMLKCILISPVSFCPLGKKRTVSTECLLGSCPSAVSFGSDLVFQHFRMATCNPIVSGCCTWSHRCIWACERWDSAKWKCAAASKEHYKKSSSVCWFIFFLTQSNLYTSSLLLPKEDRCIFFFSFFKVGNFRKCVFVLLRGN